MLFQNTKGQTYEVLETMHEEISGRRRTLCKIRFTETGTVDIVRKDALKRGNIKDRYAKDVRGVACIGNARKSDNPREYNVWNGMIERCYNPNSKHYSRYGGRGITVEDRWLCFEYFLEDIEKIEGFDRLLFDDGLLEIDKDIKGGGRYSLKDCIFVSAQVNTKYRDMSSLKENTLKAIGISPNGERFIIHNIASFAVEHGLDRSHIYECIHKKRKSHKKWSFTYYE